MAKRKDIEITGGEAAATPESTPAVAPIQSGLPEVESPSISPAIEMPATAIETPAPAIEPEIAEASAIEPIVAQAPAIESITEPATVANWRVVLRPRHKRYALLAASVTLAAALGAIVGAGASGGFSTPARTDVAALEANKAMQQSIARLGHEITTLKASLDQANKSARNQIAKISERLEHEATEITGSISAPQTAAPLPAPVAAPLPSPRPLPRVAAVETQPPARTPILQGWTIHDFRRGYVYVESHGEIYQVVLGAALPGLGPVQSVKRQDGRWMVQTPKGIIVSMRDRRYFEEF